MKIHYILFVPSEDGRRQSVLAEMSNTKTCKTCNGAGGQCYTCGGQGSTGQGELTIKEFETHDEAKDYADDNFLCEGVVGVWNQSRWEEMYARLIAGTRPEDFRII